MARVVPAIGTESDPRSNDAFLRLNLDRYEQAIDLTEVARRRSLESQQYYENKQWSDAEIAELKRRKQPIVTENHIQPKVDFLVGLEITTRTDPKAFPRNEEDMEAAEVATDSVRYVLDRNDFKNMSSDAWRDMLVPGYTAIELGIVQGADGTPEIEFQAYKWDRLFADAYSRKLDFSDARYLGAVKWVDLAEAIEEFPGKDNEAKLRTGLHYGDNSDTHDDRPRFAVSYSDRKRDRVMVVYMWYLEKGEWHWVKFSRGGVLEGGRSPYLDEDGKTWCPLIMQAAYKDLENNTYGIVQYWKSIQDEINHRRSRAMYHLSRRGVIKSAGVTSYDDATLKTEIAKPDYVITLDDPEGRFDVDTGQDLSQGQMALLAESNAFMERLGPNASMIGKDERDQSGRAILAQSQSGFVEMQILMDRHRHFKRRVYMGAWWMIKQYWRAPKVVRVTDNESAPTFIGLNEPIARGQYDLERLQARGASDVDIQQHMIMLAQMGILNQPVLKNEVARMQMDFVVEEVQDHATVQTEAFQQLMEFMPNFVALLQVSPQLAKAVMEASPLRNKKMIIEALEGPSDDPEAQQMQLIQQALQMRGAQAQIASAENDAALKGAQAQKVQNEAAMVPVTAQADALRGQAAYIQAVSPPF